MNMYRILAFPRLASLSLLIAIILTALAGPAMAQGSVVHATTAQKCGQWSIIPSPSPTGGDILVDVVAVAADDAWAVGNSAPYLHYSRTLAEHWNGKAWTVVATPNIGPYGSNLSSVVALASNNVWAVGYYQSKSTLDHSLVEHWNGKVWSIVASPKVGIADYDLHSITAVAPNDIWALGDFKNKAGSYQAMAEHWNGKDWQVVSIPTPKSQYSGLSSITAVSKNDIWSVGYTSSSSLTEHWNGSRWQIVASPDVAQSSLDAVTAISSTDVWAVGSAAGKNNMEQTLTEHWDGKSWKVVASPTPMNQRNLHITPQFGESPNMLEGVTAITTNNVWAVGNYVNGKNPMRTLIEHWDGKQWSVVPSPNLGSDNTSLWAAARVGTTNDVWAAGYGSVNGMGANTLTEYYC